MRQVTLAGLVKRRFLHRVQRGGESVRALVAVIGVPPGHLCRLIANQRVKTLPLATFVRVAHWLGMPLVNVLALAEIELTLDELVSLGMTARGLEPTNAADQEHGAQQAGVSVAVFRRALHGYPDFRPSMRTCDRLAGWLAWTGYGPEDVVRAAGMRLVMRPDGVCVSVTPEAAQTVGPYPCACGRAGCMVPAHVPQPHGQRRKWRSDACRMWARRQIERAGQGAGASAALPQPAPIVRFIVINERRFPVRTAPQNAPS